MTTAEKLIKVAENVPKVYETGKKAGSDEVWDAIQANGNRTNYRSAFLTWETPEYITPKYPIRTSTMYETFNSCRALKELPPIEFTVDKLTFYSCFTACRSLKEIIMDIRPDEKTASSLTSTFNTCVSLQTINKIIVTEGMQYSSTFNFCESLVNLTFEGVIGNNMNLSYSPLLSKESILNVLDCLANKTSGSFVLTLGTKNLAKLTDAEKAIATEKGWSLA